MLLIFPISVVLSVTVSLQKKPSYPVTATSIQWPQSDGSFLYLAIIVTFEWHFLLSDQSEEAWCVSINHQVSFLNSVRNNLCTFLLMVMQLLYLCPAIIWFPFEVLTIFKACLLIWTVSSKHDASCCCDMPGQKKVYFRAVFFYKGNFRNRIISIFTVHVVNDVHTYILS